jgi:hypothetical protein
MTKPRRRFIIALVVVWLAFGLTSLTYDFLNRRAIASEVAQEKSTAMASTSKATTFDDARRWLEAHGYRVIIWNPHDPRGFVAMQESTTDGKHRIVMGERQIRVDGWLVDPVWLRTTFRFNLSGKFHNVQVDPWPFSH